MSITLRPVDKDNWRQICNLKVAEDQQNWVMPNWFSILQAHFEFGSVRAVYADEAPVGLIYYGTIPGDERYWIIRLMIDHNHQHKGFGRAAMKAMIQEMQEHTSDLYISVVPGNDIARNLYLSLGFIDLEQIEEGEQVFCLHLPNRTNHDRNH